MHTQGLGAQMPYAWGGLSGKLLLLTISFVMLAEVFIYVPSVANFRNSWMTDRLTTAGVAAAVLSETNTIAPRLQQELLRATGAVAIALDFGSRRSLIAMNETPLEITMVVDMSDMSPWRSIVQSFQTLAHLDGGLLRVVGQGQMGLVEKVDVVLPINLLRNDMFAFSWRILGLSLVISVITAALVYISLQALFVRPLQRLTRAMDRFAETPEDPSCIIPPAARKDELGEAQARLSVMQEALARALHQKQRLADLGLAVSKINHDLRNLLASAQLFLERLEHVEDPTVRRLAPKIVATLDRAVGYTQAVMSYGKAQESAPQRRWLNLYQVVLDVTDVLGLHEHPAVQLEVRVPKDLEVDADPEQLFRVLLNLCRNSLQALETELDPAIVRRIDVHGVRQGCEVSITVTDTGPGIPAQTRKALFKAFHSSSKSGGVGLGLAIAAELLRAHGGRISLEDSRRGTQFLIVLPDRSA
ncbi:HAMP domain-containing histidine kinase [Roseibium sp. CAU 1637]|uniref:histidine kinase n=2 Tax=Stappiaceae TaxID=2821832 RepID=A0A939EPS9_9HYPH|nr:HAMP domain-containing histidine kinase [Roseibium limicola]